MLQPLLRILLRLLTPYYFLKVWLLNKIRLHLWIWMLMSRYDYLGGLYNSWLFHRLLFCLQLLLIGRKRGMAAIWRRSHIISFELLLQLHLLLSLLAYVLNVTFFFNQSFLLLLRIDCILMLFTFLVPRSWLIHELLLKFLVFDAVYFSKGDSTTNLRYMLIKSWCLVCVYLIGIVRCVIICCIIKCLRRIKNLA